MPKKTNAQPGTPATRGESQSEDDEPDAPDAGAPIHLQDIATALHDIKGTIRAFGTRLATVEQLDTSTAGGGEEPQCVRAGWMAQGDMTTALEPATITPRH
jgi:hypothetical protein